MTFIELIIAILGLFISAAGLAIAYFQFRKEKSEVKEDDINALFPNIGQNTKQIQLNETLAELLLVFLKAHEGWSFTPRKISKWGSKQECFASLKAYRVKEIDNALQKLHLLGILNIKRGKLGNKLYYLHPESELNGISKGTSALKDQITPNLMAVLKEVGVVLLEEYAKNENDANILESTEKHEETSDNVLEMNNEDNNKDYKLELGKKFLVIAKEVVKQKVGKRKS